MERPSAGASLTLIRWQPGAREGISIASRLIYNVVLAAQYHRNLGCNFVSGPASSGYEGQSRCRALFSCNIVVDRYLLRRSSTIVGRC